MIPVSNASLPQTLHIEHYAGDTFARYLVLKNFDGTSFDATGYVFDFVILQGTQKLYKISNLTAQSGNGFIFIALQKEGIKREGLFDFELKASKGGITRTWLDGDFYVSRDATDVVIEPDIIYIQSLLLEVEIEVLLLPPALVVVPLPVGLETFSLDTTFILA